MNNNCHGPCLLLTDWFLRCGAVFTRTDCTVETSTHTKDETKCHVDGTLSTPSFAIINSIERKKLFWKLVELFLSRSIPVLRTQLIHLLDRSLHLLLLG